MNLIHLNLLVNMFIWRFYIKDIILFRNLLVRPSTLVRHALWMRGGCLVSSSCFGSGRDSYQYNLSMSYSVNFFFFLNLII
jgi:hypothetical protein